MDRPPCPLRVSHEGDAPQRPHAGGLRLAARLSVGSLRFTGVAYLAQDEDRCAALALETKGLFMDYSRQRVGVESMVCDVLCCLSLTPHHEVARPGADTPVQGCPRCQARGENRAASCSYWPLKGTFVHVSCLAPHAQAAMAAGEHINVTEDRAVMHMALRAAPEQVRWHQHAHSKLSRLHRSPPPSADVRRGRLQRRARRT